MKDHDRRKAMRLMTATVVVGGACSAFVGAGGGEAMRGFVVASLVDGAVVTVAPERAAAPYVRAMGTDAEQSRNAGGTR